MTAWLSANASAWAEGGLVYDLAVEEVDTDRLAGCVGIQRGLDYLSPGQVNLTYAVYPAWRGRGFATRAVRLSMQVARRRGTVAQFVIRVAPGNLERSASPSDWASDSTTSPMTEWVVCSGMSRLSYAKDESETTQAARPPARAAFSRPALPSRPSVEPECV